MTSCLVSFSSWTRQRRLGLVLALQHPGDVADLGRHAGRRDHELAGAARHVRVHVDHVGAVAERRVGRRRPRRRPCRPAGSRRSAPPRRPRASPPPARARRRARRRRPRSRRRRPGTSCSAGSCASAPSRRTRALTIIIFASAATAAAALPSWLRPEHRVEQRQQQDHDPRAGLLDRVDRDHAGDQQHDLHRVLVLAQERVPARLGLRLGELVRAVAAPAARRPRRSSAPAPARRAAPAAAPSRESTCQVGASVVGRRRCGGRHLVPLSAACGRRPRRARRACRPRRAAAPACRGSSRSPRSRRCARRTSRRRGPSAPSSPRRTRTRASSCGRRVADRALLGRAPVRVDRVDVGDDQQRVGADLDRQQRARQVLVDHGLDADAAAVPAGAGSSV